MARASIRDDMHDPLPPAQRNLNCIFLPRGKYLIGESNWGEDGHADWYLNLRKQPQAGIEVNASFAERGIHPPVGVRDEETSSLFGISKDDEKKNSDCGF